MLIDPCDTEVNTISRKAIEYPRGDVIRSAEPHSKEAVSSYSRGGYFEFDYAFTLTCIWELWVEYATRDPRPMKVYRGFIVPNNKPHQKPRHEEKPSGPFGGDISWEQIGEVGRDATGGWSNFNTFFVTNVSFIRDVRTYIRFASGFAIPHVRTIILQR